MFSRNYENAISILLKKTKFQQHTKEGRYSMNFGNFDL